MSDIEIANLRDTIRGYVADSARDERVINNLRDLLAEAKTIILAASLHSNWIPDAYIRDSFQRDAHKLIEKMKD